MAVEVAVQEGLVCDMTFKGPLSLLWARENIIVNVDKRVG